LHVFLIRKKLFRKYAIAPRRCNLRGANGW
jgi:hypothetical protein